MTIAVIIIMAAAMSAGSCSYDLINTARLGGKLSSGHDLNAPGHGLPVSLHLFGVPALLARLSGHASHVCGASSVYSRTA